MTTVDLITFTFSIITGAVSITLGVLAIWLSLTQNKQAQSSLDKVKELTSEIRSLVDVGIKQQDKFSSKMLDSILNEDNYGLSVDENYFGEYIEKTVRNKMEQSEKEMLDLVENKIQNISKDDDSDVKESVEELRSTLKILTNKTIEEVSQSVKLPNELKSKLKSFLDYPAHYILILIIIKENISTIEEIDQINNKYGIPDRYEGGIKNLLEKDILSGDIDSFKINSEYEPFIRHWIYNNKNILNRIIKLYKNKDKVASSTEENIVDQISF